MVSIVRTVLYIALGFSAALLGLCFYNLQPPDPLTPTAQARNLKSMMLVVPGEPPRGPVDLVIKQGRIDSIHPSAGASVKGYILPGLVDAHMHGPMLPFPGEQALYAFLNLYHGVTLTRMAAGTAAMRDAIAAGDYAGPRMLTCGPFVDGNPPLWRNSRVVENSADASPIVAELAAAGFDCIKVYNELTAEASAAVYRSAKRLSLPVIGHVPWRQDATAAFIDDHQHLLGLPPAVKTERPKNFVRAMQRIADNDEQRIAQLAKAWLGSGTTLTPTLITLQRKFALQDYQQLETSTSAALLPRYYRRLLWHHKNGLVSSRLFDDRDYARFQQAYPKAEEALRQLYRAGVELHTGTDAPAEFITPGAGLIEELELLNAAGFTAEQTLGMSSVDSARALMGVNYATLTPGSPADFVIYKNNPTLDLAHLGSRTAVVSSGHYYSRAMLDAQMELYQQWYQRPGYRFVTEALVGTMLRLIAQLQSLRE